MRLYKAQYVLDPFDPELDEELNYRGEQPEPEGWREYAIERWGMQERADWPKGYQPFFMPSDRKLYRSRSSAQARVDLINYWGGEAVLVEADVEWIPVAEANKRRKAQRLYKRYSDKLREAREIEQELDALEGGAV